MRDRLGCKPADHQVHDDDCLERQAPSLGRHCLRGVCCVPPDITGQLASSRRLPIGAVGNSAACRFGGRCKQTRGRLNQRGEALAAAAVDATKLASSIKAVEIVSALPSTGNVEGRFVYLTTDEKLYRYTGSAWTSAVPATDVAGQIVSTQITDGAISTPKLAAGAVIASTIAAGAVTAGAIAANAVTTGTIAARRGYAGQIAAGAITADKMVLGDFTNRVENPNFGAGDVSWSKSTGITIVNDPANAYVGSWYMNVGVGATGLASRNSNIFPVLPGEQYFLQVFAKAVGAPNNPLTVRMRFLLADKISLVSAPTVGNYTAADTAYIERNGGYHRSGHRCIRMDRRNGGSRVYHHRWLRSGFISCSAPRYGQSDR